MEEKQIRAFVHRVSQDENLRSALTQDPEQVIMREGFSPRVAQVIAKLVPYFSAESLERKQFTFWN
jgi:hypothetical protein